MPLSELQRLHISFARDEICILGLPFDRVTENQALATLDDAIERKNQCFLSTPNLNFAIGSLKDVEFGKSVYQSDLSVADGMPLIVISRLIGAGLPERVAGSTLFDRMRNRELANKVSVFFFGGMGNVAELAVDELNMSSKGVKSVGSINPGTGSVEEMSSEAVIQAINDAEPDFVLVSLGAKKGQEWILRNHKKLNTSVISHLGAVVNFVAGSVKRAPRLWQKFGLEWVWRIVEEPSLWKRYFFDGLTFLRLVLTRVIPLAIYGRFLLGKQKDRAFTYSMSRQGENRVLRLSGVAIQSRLSELKADLPEAILGSDQLFVDIRELSYADSAFWALMLRLKTELSIRGKKFILKGTSSSTARLGRLNMVDSELDLQC